MAAVEPPKRRQRPRSGAATRTLPMDEGTGLSRIAQDVVRQRHRPALIVLTGDRVGERLSIQGNFLIGRAPDAALALSDPNVSWHHALVEDRGERYALVDLESTNGTYVNGARSAERELSHGDKLRVGGTTLRFEVQDEADAEFTAAVQRLISIDDLTGLYLRRRFDAELAGIVGTARAGSSAVGLLAMDLDGIKAINDQHGHLFGAYTISECGKLIGQEVAERGIACRFGGDEFIVALPGHDLTESITVAETIRLAIANHPFEYEGTRLRPGISIGVATFPDDAPDPVGLFKKADAALYAAKRAGKNRVLPARSRS